MGVVTETAGHLLILQDQMQHLTRLHAALKAAGRVALADEVSLTISTGNCVKADLHQRLALLSNPANAARATA